jgi:putative membrane protein
VPVIRPWATNQGWYNLFLAAGALGGVVLVNTWDETAGRTLALFACGCMIVAGIVLFVLERRLWRGSLGQAAPPLIAVLASLA